MSLSLIIKLSTFFALTNADFSFAFQEIADVRESKSEVLWWIFFILNGLKSINSPRFQIKSQPEVRSPPGSGYGGPQTSSQHRNTTDPTHNQKVQMCQQGNSAPSGLAFKN